MYYLPEGQRGALRGVERGLKVHHGLLGQALQDHTVGLAHFEDAALHTDLKARIRSSEPDVLGAVDGGLA